jgi:hypothetical protein
MTTGCKHTHARSKSSALRLEAARKHVRERTIESPAHDGLDGGRLNPATEPKARQVIAKLAQRPNTAAATRKAPGCCSCPTPGTTTAATGGSQRTIRGAGTLRSRGWALGGHAGRLPEGEREVGGGHHGHVELGNVSARATVKHPDR